MSILNFPQVGRRNLENMYNYIVDPNSTQNILIFGLGINPRYAIEEMKFAHFAFCNSREHYYQQIIFSFDDDVQKKLTLQQIEQVGKEIGLIFAFRYQVLAALHVNTKNWHFHYLVNSLNIENGKCFEQEGSVYCYFKRINKILAKYNLEPIEYYGYDSFSYSAG